jgi:integral membrane sensor domain MASE1
MEPKDTTTTQDVSRRKRSGWFIGTGVFVVAYAIFVLSYDHWGLALGWMPSTIIAAAFGRLAYCFPWIVDVVAILLELIGAVIG